MPPVLLRALTPAQARSIIAPLRPADEVSDHRVMSVVRLVHNCLHPNSTEVEIDVPDQGIDHADEAGRHQGRRAAVNTLTKRDSLHTLEPFRPTREETLDHLLFVIRTAVSYIHPDVDPGQFDIHVPPRNLMDLPLLPCLLSYLSLRDIQALSSTSYDLGRMYREMWMGSLKSVLNEIDIRDVDDGRRFSRFVASANLESVSEIRMNLKCPLGHEFDGVLEGVKALQCFMRFDGNYKATLVRLAGMFPNVTTCGIFLLGSVTGTSTFPRPVLGWRLKSLTVHFGPFTGAPYDCRVWDYEWAAAEPRISTQSIPMLGELEASLGSLESLVLVIATTKHHNYGLSNRGTIQFLLNSSAQSLRSLVLTGGRAVCDMSDVENLSLLEHFDVVDEDTQVERFHPRRLPPKLRYERARGMPIQWFHPPIFPHGSF